MVDVLRTAKGWGQAPSTILGTRLPVWCEEDRLLSLALTDYEAALCPGGCGHFLDETIPDDGMHEATPQYCDACAARDEYRHEHRDDSAESRFGELIAVHRLD